MTTASGSASPSPARSVPPSVMAATSPRLPLLVGWHVGLGETALRVFLLHLLWVLGVIAGAGVAGVFPATAAVHGGLRRDQMDRRLEAEGRNPAPRSRLSAEYWALWRTQFMASQRLGLLLAVGWAVLAVDRAVLRSGAAGDFTPWLSGVLVVLGVLLAVLTALAWPMQAHFADGTARVLRMSFVLALSRPLLVMAVAGAVLVWFWLLSAAPGVCVVFGVALPAWTVTALAWRTGALPLPAARTAACAVQR